MTRTRSDHNGKVRAAALLMGASLAALLADMHGVSAAECAPTGAPPANIASPSTLYDTLRTHTNAELLAIGFRRKPMATECAWVYEVKVLTASGSVVELDFEATRLDLVGARGPDHDRDAAALVESFGGDAGVLASGENDRRGSASRAVRPQAAARAAIAVRAAMVAKTTATITMVERTVVTIVAARVGVRAAGAATVDRAEAATADPVATPAVKAATATAARAVEIATAARAVEIATAARAVEIATAARAGVISARAGG